MAHEVDPEEYDRFSERNGMYRSKAFQPGSFGCHEALDRCSMLAKLVDDFSGHPAIEINADWKAAAEHAAKLLADLYQAIGSSHLPAMRETES